MPGLMVVTVLGLIPVVGPVYQPRAIKPVMSWSESIEDSVKGAFLRCHSAEEWERIWRKYHPQGESDGWRARPEIDFSSHMVVVICHGGSAGGTELNDPAEESECVRIRYRASLSQFRPQNDPVEQEKQNAYFRRAYRYRLTFIVIPVTGKELVFEDNVSDLSSGPPVWKEVVRLPAICPK